MTSQRTNRALQPTASRAEALRFSSLGDVKQHLLPACPVEAGAGECAGRSHREAEVTTASHGEPGRVSQNRAGLPLVLGSGQGRKDQHFLEQESPDRAQDQLLLCVALPTAGERGQHSEV